MQSLGFTGEVRGTPEQPGMRELPSVNETERAPLSEGRDRRLSGGRAGALGTAPRAASAMPHGCASCSCSRCAPRPDATPRRRATSS